MNYKAISLALILAVASISLVGCGSSDSQDTTTADQVVEDTTTAEDTQQEETTTVTEESDSVFNNLQGYLNNTCWVGVDVNKNIYTVSFSGDAIQLYNVYTTGDMPHIYGYWEVDSNKLYVYSDDELTDITAQYYFDILETDTNNVMYIDNACLTQIDYSKAEDLGNEVYKLYDVQDVISILNSKTYWIAKNDTSVAFLYIDGNNIHYYKMDKSSHEDLAYACRWGIDCDKLYFADASTNSYIGFTWSINEDGDTLKLTDKDGETLSFKKSDFGDITSTMEVFNKYLDGQDASLYTTVVTTTEADEDEDGESSDDEDSSNEDSDGNDDDDSSSSDDDYSYNY